MCGGRNPYHGAKFVTAFACGEYAGKGKGGSKMETTLDRLREGECGTIRALRLSGALRRRLMDFGLIEGTSVCCIRKSPAGSPVLYGVRGTMLALRICDGRQIAIERCG